MHKPASICFATEDFQPGGGGVAVSAQRICRYLAQDGFDVHAVTVFREGTGPGETTISVEDGVTVHRIHTDPGGLKRVLAFRHYIWQLHAQKQFDLFHGFFLSAALPCLGPARKHKPTPRPLIASIRGTDATTLFVHPYFRPLLLDALQQAAWVTSVNQTYLDDVSRQVEIAGRCSVIRNSAPVIPRSWELTDENRGIVGSSGHFRRVKDVPLLIRGFRNVRPEVRRRLILAGPFIEPVEEEWSRTLIGEFGLTADVEITGLLSHSESLARMAGMHVYVQCSAFEGMPNALLEAAAVGVPIVATAVGGVKEIFTNEVDALLVPHGDPKALGRAMERVLENPELARSLSTNASLLCTKFNKERERAEWVTLHRRVLEQDAEATKGAFAG